LLVDVACGFASFIGLKKLLINGRWLGDEPQLLFETEFSASGIEEGYVCLHLKPLIWIPHD